MPVRRRAAAARGQRALHQGEVAAVLLGQGLEQHHAAAGGVASLALTAPEDPGRHRPHGTPGPGARRTPGGQQAALSTAAAAKNAMIRITPCRYAASGSPGTTWDRMATRPATPRTVPTWRAMFRIPLPVPKWAGVSDGAARAEQRRDGQADPGAAEQLDRQQVGQVGRVGLDLGQPEQLGAGVHRAADHRHPAGPAETGGQAGGDQPGERQHHERARADGQPGHHRGVVPDAGEELDRVEHEGAEPGVVEDRGRERAAEGPRAEQPELDDRGVVPARADRPSPRRRPATPAGGR